MLLDSCNGEVQKGFGLSYRQFHQRNHLDTDSSNNVVIKKLGDISPHTGHNHDYSYDTSTGWFQEVDSRVFMSPFEEEGVYCLANVGPLVGP